MDKQEINYTEIYKAFSPKILHYLNSYFSVEDSEDLLQEIFIKILNSLHSFRHESSIKTWVYKIATNAIIDKSKNKNYSFYRTQIREETNIIHFNNTQFDSTFDIKIEKDEMYDCIRQFISELTEKNKIVFVLNQYEGLSNSEIAEILKISYDSVKIRLHRAKESLKASLKKNCEIYFDNNGEITCEPK